MAFDSFRRNASILVLLATVFTGISPAAIAAVYSPDLNELDLDWSNHEKISATGGVLTVQPPAERGTGWGLLNNSLLMTDMTMTVQTDFTPADPAHLENSMVMVFFASKDLSNGYNFCLNAKGHFNVNKLDDSKWNHLVKWSGSGAIKRSGWNTVKIVVKGKRATIFANGTQLTTVPVEVPAGGGKVGFEVVDVTGRFRNLVVNY